MKPELKVITGGAPYFVERLEYLLEKARSGELESLGVVWVEQGSVWNDWIISPKAKCFELIGGMMGAVASLTDFARGK